MSSRHEKPSYHFCCDEIFGDKSELNNHNKMVHNMTTSMNNNDDTNLEKLARNRRCPFCKTNFKGTKEFIDHIKSVHEQDDGACGICKAKMKRPTSLVYHFKKHIKNVLETIRLKDVFTKEEDSYCGTDSEEMDDSENNIVNVKKELAIPRKSSKKCVPCGGMILTNREVNSHIQRRHTGGRMKCKVCLKHFKKPSLHFRKKHMDHI